jgi:DNA polymerase-3 subunit delta
LTANYPQDRQRILSIEADQLGIQLNQDAWTWLEQHHEHNLLAAKNSLMRVADTFPDQNRLKLNIYNNVYKINLFIALLI